MGKARILSAQGEGLYSIEILEDRTRAEAARTTAVQRVAQLDARITDFEADLSSAQTAVDAAVADQDQAIADYQAALQDDGIDTAAARQAMTDAGEAVLQAAAQRDAVRGAIRAAKAERLTLQARIERIDALPPLRQVSAWCADYVEDLSGEVATAEVPGEIGQVIIQPGFSDGAAWSPSEDGAIQPALAGTPASVFYNLAMMPGWQRWRPTFRIATISNINNDLCDITLDAATSSQQGLNVNAQGGYSGVPIYYMDCNGDAFENGDKVLVAFSGNTNQPMVVGFEQEPKECGFWVTEAYSIFDASWSGDLVFDQTKSTLETDREAVGGCFTKVTFLSKTYDLSELSRSRIILNAQYKQKDSSIFESDFKSETYFRYQGAGSFSVSSSVGGYRYQKSVATSCMGAAWPGSDNGFQNDSRQSDQNSVLEFSTSYLGPFEISLKNTFRMQYSYQKDETYSGSGDVDTDTSSSFSITVTQDYMIDGAEVSSAIELKSGSGSDYFYAHEDHVNNTVPARIHHIKLKGEELIVFEYEMHSMDQYMEDTQSAGVLSGYVFTLRKSGGSWSSADLNNYEGIAPAGSENYDEMQRMLDLIQIPG